MEKISSVEKFVKTLRDNFPDDKIILTTVTKTGNEVANKKLSNTVDKIVYFPFDLFFAVKSFINKIKKAVKEIVWLIFESLF